MKCYSDLIKLTSFEERVKYLQTKSKIGLDTFGFDRYLNQSFYNSREWKKVRDIVIIRDNGCDLGCIGHDIYGKILIHHMNPINKEQVINRDPIIFDPEFLISVSHDTHNMIHYCKEYKSNDFVERKPNDTIPWRN